MARRPRPRAALPVLPACTIFRWDLDKTYLKTEFGSVRDLVRIPFEKPEDKVAAPGVVALIQQLRSVAASAGREVRVYFVSASPPQIGQAIKDKLALDGIEYDGIVFKNQLQHIVRGRFRNLREHIGYKLSTLLASRSEAPSGVREYLFGDDWESDPLIYSLYADLVAGRVDDATLREVLRQIPVDPQQIEEVATLNKGITAEDSVARIYINLERRTPPANFHAFGARLVPSFNYFQTAAALFEGGQLTLSAVATVAQSLIEESGYTPDRLANSLADVIRRRHVHQPSAIALREYLMAQGLLPSFVRARGGRASLWQRLTRWFRSRRPEALPPPALLDYRQLVLDLRSGRAEL